MQCPFCLLACSLCEFWPESAAIWYGEAVDKDQPLFYIANPHWENEKEKRL
jgi:hypothetical protein